MLGDWRRVSRKRPCPVCSKCDWCGVSADGTAAVCMRIESGRVLRNGGYLHRLGESADFRPIVRRVSVPNSPTAAPMDFGRMTGEYQHRATATMLTRLATDLGVSVEGLRRLRTGWDGSAWTFPMTDANSAAVGIRRRLPTGKKLSVKSGREGLFVPEGLSADGLLLICEGPTDTAALLSIGLDAIGRPSCRGGLRLLTEFCRGRAVALLADSDRPGIQGAEFAATALQLHCRSVRVLQPPTGVKDAREWCRRSGTREDVEEAIRVAPARSLGVKVKR